MLAKDWMVRLWELWRIHRDESESTQNRYFALIGMFRLLQGKEVDEVKWNLASVKPYLNEFREHVYSSMEGTVEGRFDKWYSDARITYKHTNKWVLHPPPRGFRFSSAQTAFFKVI